LAGVKRYFDADKKLFTRDKKHEYCAIIFFQATWCLLKNWLIHSKRISFYCHSC